MTAQKEIMTSLTDLFNKITWLRKPQMEDVLSAYSLSEIESIEAISKLSDPTVTKLAKELYLTRSAISKTTKKLRKKELIESYQKTDNKKEIYFRLTAKGNEINQLHEQVHEKFLADDQEIFAQLSPADAKAILHFLNLYNQHLDGEIQKYL